MTTYLVRRLIVLILTLLLVSIVVFVVMRIIPGDPAQIILGLQATPDAVSALRAELGLDRPLAVQYLSWIWELLRGDMGRSITYGVPITELVIQRLAVTGPLTLFAVLFSVVISIPLGIYASTHQNQAGDYGVMIFSQIGLAIPAFWAGLLLILLFAVNLHWFASGGFPGWSKSFWGSVKSLILPAAALGFIRAAVLARMTRSSLLEVLREDYVRTARSKGLAESIVIYKHAFRNAVIPVLTILGLQIGQLMAGTIIIEQVFFLPGLGRLVYLAINQRDLPVVQAVVLFIASIIVIINFLVDLIYVMLDPRIRLE
ncbi:MAG: ABC transporter permease subunit [Proteobacteria bacterium]|nr:ABC transporter permease subunit [Pseudomonadota bacterium]